MKRRMETRYSILKKSRLFWFKCKYAILCRKKIPVDDIEEESDSDMPQLVELLLEEENISNDEDVGDEETPDDCLKLLDSLQK